MKSITVITTVIVLAITMLIILGCSSEANGPNNPDGVEVLAPIESVEIEKVAAKSPNSTLIVVSGGLNSCESFNDYTLTRDGEKFQVQVTNLKPANSNVPCTANYGMMTHSIPLPSDVIEACKSYTVEVNGESHSVQASCPAIESGLSQNVPPATTTRPEMVQVSAPLESVEILTLGSFPLQYRVQVVSGLSNGCTEFDGFEVEREGETITVTVTNLEPTDKGIPCTDEYRTVTTSILLGNGLDYDPAMTYTVTVNDVTTSFVTEGKARDPGLVSATFDSSFQLRIEQTAMIDQQGPMVEFVDVVEDSRCAKGVACVWTGRARILVRVSSLGDVLGFGMPELILEAGRTDPESNTVTGVFDRYLIELSALDSYPQAVAQDSPGYTATLVVTKRPLSRIPNAEISLFTDLGREQTASPNHLE